MLEADSSSSFEQYTTTCCWTDSLTRFTYEISINPTHFQLHGCGLHSLLIKSYLSFFLLHVKAIHSFQIMCRSAILLLLVLPLSICNIYHVLSFRPLLPTMTRPCYVVKQHNPKQFSSCIEVPSSQSLSKLLVSVEGDFTTTTAEGIAIEDNDKNRIKSFLRAFYKFCRPHTIRGTILASIAGTIRALLDTPGALGKTHTNLLQCLFCLQEP